MFVAQRGLDANTQGVEFLTALVSGLLTWLGDLLGPFGEGLVHRQAGRALGQGRVECSLKVISGRQQGLSSRWRNGAAAVSPGRLELQTPTAKLGWAVPVRDLPWALEQLQTSPQTGKGGGPTPSLGGCR